MAPTSMDDDKFIKGASIPSYDQHRQVRRDKNDADGSTALTSDDSVSTTLNSSATDANSSNLTTPSPTASLTGLTSNTTSSQSAFDNSTNTAQFLATYLVTPSANMPPASSSNYTIFSQLSSSNPVASSSFSSSSSPFIDSTSTASAYASSQGSDGSLTSNHAWWIVVPVILSILLTFFITWACMRRIRRRKHDNQVYKDDFWRPSFTNFAEGTPSFFSRFSVYSRRKLHYSDTWSSHDQPSTEDFQPGFDSTTRPHTQASSMSLSALSIHNTPLPPAYRSLQSNPSIHSLANSTFSETPTSFIPAKGSPLTLVPREEIMRDPARWSGVDPLGDSKPRSMRLSSLSNSPIQDKVQVDIPFMPSTPPALSREKRSPRTPVQGSPTTPLQKCSTPVMPKLQTAPFKLEDQEVLIEEPLSLSARRTERYPLVHRGLASLLRSQHPNNTPPLKAAAPPTINEQRHL